MFLDRSSLNVFLFQFHLKKKKLLAWLFLTEVDLDVVSSLYA